MSFSLSKKLTQLKYFPKSLIPSVLVCPSVKQYESIQEIKELFNVRGVINSQDLPNNSNTILIASFIPSVYTIKIECVIGSALQSLGWDVVCLANDSSRLPSKHYHEKSLNFKTVKLHDYITNENEHNINVELKAHINKEKFSIKRFKRITYKGTNIGISSLATLFSKHIDGSAGGSNVPLRKLYRIAKRSMMLIDASDKLLESVKPSLVISVERGFVGTCEIVQRAVHKNIDYVQWCGCHQPNSIMFKRLKKDNIRAHPFSISDTNWKKIKKLEWSEEYEKEVIGEFVNGYDNGTWYKYKNLTTKNRKLDSNQLRDKLGINNNRKTAVIYSHILNDANLFYGKDIFEGGYREWLVETIRATEENNNINWVLKLHPANCFRNANLGYKGEYGEITAIKDALGSLPKYLKIIYPDEPISPRSFFKITDWGVTVRGTVGLELPCFGIPVITAGSGRYSHKGFTIDSDSSQAYIEQIKRIDNIPALSLEQQHLAILHAYFVFKNRPSSYDQLFEDVYNFPAGHFRQRDIEPKNTSINDMFENSQMCEIISFLTNPDNEDFLTEDARKLLN